MIVVNIDKAKSIAHDMRRAFRAEEFRPLDEVIMKQIPGTDAAAVEAERQAIRDKYASIQVQLDAASTPEAIKQVLGI